MALKNTRIINGEGRPRLIVRKGTTYQSPGNKGETYGATSAKIPLARGVDLNATDEYMSKANPVDLDPNGSQIISNPGFETDLTGWTATRCTNTRDTSIKRTGAASMKCHTWDLSGTDFGSTWGYGVAINGQKYTAEAWVYVPAGNTSKTFRLRVSSNNNEFNQESGNIVIASFDTWTKVVFHTQYNIATPLQLRLSVMLKTPGASDLFYVDDTYLGPGYDAIVGCRFKANQTSATHQLFEYTDPQGVYFPHLRISTNELIAQVYDGTTLKGLNYPFTDTQSWHSVFMTINRTGNLSLYLDGIVVGTIDMTAVGKKLLQGTPIFSVGGRGSSPGLYFNGQIGEAIYVRYSSLPSDFATQIANAHTNGIPSTWGGVIPKAHYKFEGSSDTEMLADISGTGNNLTGTNVTQADDQVVADYPSVTERLSLKGIKVGMMASSLITGSPDKPVYGRITSVDDATHTLGIDEWKGGVPTNQRQLTVDGFVIDLPRCQEMTEIFTPDVLVHKLYRSRKDSKHRGWTYRCILDYSKLTTGDMLVEMIQALNLGEEDNLILIPRLDVPGFQYNAFYAESISLTKARGQQGYKKPVFVFDAEDPLASWPILDGYGSGYALNWGHQE